MPVLKLGQGEETRLEIQLQLWDSWVKRLKGSRGYRVEQHVLKCERGKHLDIYLISYQNANSAGNMKKPHNVGNTWQTR